MQQYFLCRILCIKTRCVLSCKKIKAAWSAAFTPFDIRKVHTHGQFILPEDVRKIRPAALFVKRKMVGNEVKFIIFRIDKVGERESEQSPRYGRGCGKLFARTARRDSGADLSVRENRCQSRPHPRQSVRLRKQRTSGVCLSDYRYTPLCFRDKPLAEPTNAPQRTRAAASARSGRLHNFTISISSLRCRDFGHASLRF